MPDVIALPSSGELLADARGGGRWMRVTWHHEAGLVVLSLWHQERCAATFRLPAADVPALVQALMSGLAQETTDTEVRPILDPQSDQTIELPPA